MSLLDKFQRELVTQFAKLEEKYFHQIKLFSNCEKYIFNWVKYKPTKSSAPRWTTSHSWSPTSIILQGSHPPSQIENCNWCIITTNSHRLQKLWSKFSWQGEFSRSCWLDRSFTLQKSFILYTTFNVHIAYCVKFTKGVAELLCWTAEDLKLWSLALANWISVTSHHCRPKDMREQKIFYSIHFPV